MRQFLLSWIGTLLSVPDIHLLQFIPQLLDGIYQTLADGDGDVRRQALALLSDILNSIKTSNERDEPNISAMLLVLVKHCHKGSSTTPHVVQLTAMEWILEFAILKKNDILSHIPYILEAIIPQLSNSISEISEKAEKVNSLVELAKSNKGLDGLELPLEYEKGTMKCNTASIHTTKSHDEINSNESLGSSTSSTSSINLSRLNVSMKQTGESGEMDDDKRENGVTKKTIQILALQLVNVNVDSRVAALQWISSLMDMQPHGLFNSIDFFKRNCRV